jgi:glucokinase
MAFITCGTGFGAGLILGGRLYRGANDMAGEIGHVRLDSSGPAGYGKLGSCEGFCSGGGIAQLARQITLERIQRGEKPSFCPSPEGLFALSAKTVASAAEAGDPLALEIYGIVGDYLGRALAIRVDLLNPERIVVGSIFQRAELLLRPSMELALARECLPHALRACEVVPAALGDTIGDFAALSVAIEASEANEANTA